MARKPPSAGALPLNESLLDAMLIKHAPWSMALMEGPTHVVRHANQSFCRLVGITAKKLIGAEFLVTMPMQANCAAMLARVFQSGKSESHTERYKAGSAPLLWSYTIWPVPSGEHPWQVMLQVTESGAFHERTVAMNEGLILGSVRQHELTAAAQKLNERLQIEITERKQTELMLHRSEVLFSSLVAQAPVGVYVVDSGFRLQQVNPRALSLFIHVHPLIGRDFSEVLTVLWPKQVAEQTAAKFRQTLKTGKAYRAPAFSERRRDIGVREIYEWQIQRVVLPAGEFGVVCFFNNITEQVHAELAQRRLDIMTASNEKLRKEIVRRQAVEAALTQSERKAHALLAESDELQKKLRHLSHRMLTVQEDQRKEISRELHDKITQLLIGINVRLAIFVRAAVVNPQGIGRTIAPLRRLVSKSVRTVHQFSRELRPSMLDDLGLIPALRAYLGDFPKRKGRKVRFKAYAGVETLSNDKRTMLYRVAQEALTNIARHAHASEVKVSILKFGDGVCLKVSDNGRAFDVERLASVRWSRRLGLTGMRERVEMMGGRFSIESEPGSGTTIRAIVSFADSAVSVAS